MFGPHETNLAKRRALSDRHVAYYQARASGGAGVIVVEEASVDDSDWPYERAPLASQAPEGWSRISRACHEEGALVIAALGHAGGQGSSAYHQRVLLGPSPVPDVETREVPKAMEPEEIEALIAAFGVAAAGGGRGGLRRRGAERRSVQPPAPVLLQAHQLPRRRARREPRRARAPGDPGHRETPSTVPRPRASSVSGFLVTSLQHGRGSCLRPPQAF